jgi:undecaprenyl-diphosphatase
MWKINLEIFHAINGLAGRHFFDVLATTLNDNQLLRILVLAAPYAYFWHQAKDASDKGKLMSGLISVLIAIIIARIFAHILPFEVRPLFNSASGFRQLSIPSHPDLENWSAFPSDTAAVCCALPFSLYFINRITSIVFLSFSFILFVVPRIYIGIHYPADILAGSLIGILCAIGTQPLSNSRPMQLLLSLEKARPGLFHFWLLIVLAESALMFGGLRVLLRMVRDLALQLPFLQVSESMGNHDSKIVDAASVD